MKKRLSCRVVSEHGLISNFLPALELVDQIRISNIFSRTYQVTVSWNSSAVQLIEKEINCFPAIDNISAEFVCKRTYAKIEGQRGFFYGSVSKSTD